jgi:hypothetical protein
MIERDCTTLVNPITGDAKAFLLDRFVRFGVVQSCRRRIGPRDRVLQEL